MRIIGGEYRGRSIRMPKAAKVRPTQDRVREAIFNVIREAVPGSAILDLYAGSGAFGIEALSRGAESCIFVDNNIDCVKTIRSNLKNLIMPPPPGRLKPQVLELDAIRAISRLEEEGKKFDLVFLDPPYQKELAKNCLIKIDACDILSQHSFLIAEHFKKDILPDNLSNIIIIKEKRYGDTVVSFYRHR